MKVPVLVLGVSAKKEQGWVRFIPINGRWSWDDMGAHFDKGKYLNLFTAPGVYKLDLENVTTEFGARPKYEVRDVELISDFEALVSETE